MVAQALQRAAVEPLMILLLCFDLHRRGGIERLSLQIPLPQASRSSRPSDQHAQAGSWSSRAVVGSLRVCAATGVVASKCSTGAEHACACCSNLQTLWLKPQQLSCWLHGIEVWGRRRSKARRRSSTLSATHRQQPVHLESAELPPKKSGRGAPHGRSD